MNTVIVAIIAAAAAALVSWALTHFISKSKYAVMEGQLKEKEASHQREISELKKAHEESLDQQLKAVKDQMTVQTEKLLKAREEELREGNKTNMDSLLAPLKESMKKMEDAMKSNAESHLKSNTELKSQLEQAVKEMAEKTTAVGAKADSLSEALTGRPKVQGCWGENFLNDILSREGLIEGTHYSREVANTDLSRPDFVFHFKEGNEGKDLVVDSKVSLTAFVKYMNADSAEEKEGFLKEHIASIRKHIDELASKDYAKKIDKSKRFADYVLMFMPYDMAFRAALDKEPMLWQEAYDKNILIATDQTIMPFLKIIQLTWNKYQQDTNIEEITKAASDMIERVGLFYDSYKDLGAKLKAVCKEYNLGINKLKDDGRSISTSAKKVMKIGAKREKNRELVVPEEKIYLNEESEDTES